MSIDREHDKDIPTLVTRIIPSLQDEPPKFIGKQFSKVLDCNISMAMISNDEYRSTIAVALFTSDGLSSLDSFVLEIDTEALPDLIESGRLFSMVEEMVLNIEMQKKEAESSHDSISYN